MNPGLFILLIVLIAGGLAFVYLKILDNPEERFRKTALSGIDANRADTFPPFYYYLKITDKNGILKDDVIINPDMLVEGSDYIVGRIVGNPKSKDFKEKIAYKLDNKDLYFGIKTPVASNLSRQHFVLFKNIDKNQEVLLAIQSLDNKKIYLIENGIETETDQVVLNDFEVVVVKAGGYNFTFKRIIVDDFADEEFTEDYIRRHTRKSQADNKVKKKRYNPYATRSEAEIDATPQGGTVVNKKQKPSSGGGRKIRR